MDMVSVHLTGLRNDALGRCRNAGNPVIFVGGDADLPRQAPEKATDSGSENGIPAVAAAGYLADLLPELVRIADRGGLELVAYLLEMARIEVEQATSDKDGRRL